jgi:hypothetical protein
MTAATPGPGSAIAAFVRQLDAHESAKTTLNALDDAEHHLNRVDRIAAVLAGSDFDITVTRDGREQPKGHVPFVLAVLFRAADLAGREDAP